MNTLKIKIKELLGHALLRTGLWERILRKWARRGEGIVLTYHRVIEKWDRTLDYSQPGMVVTAETFDRQLTFLKQHFQIVPLTFFLNPTPNTQHQKPVCCLTFDDGWRDNFDIAFPILKKHKVPATIFLTTDFIGTKRTFWHTRLMYVLLHREFSDGMQIARVLKAYPAVIGRRLMNIVPMTRSPYAQDVDPIIEAVKGTCDEETIEELIRDLACACGIRRPLLGDRRFFLDWDQVREMVASGIEVGSHGCSHRILTRVQAFQVQDELVRSKAEIEQRVGGNVRHFAFPDGAADRSLIESAGRAGYESVSVVTTAPEKGNTEIVTLKRVGMHEGVSSGSEGSFFETPLVTWLLRGPWTRSGLLKR